MAKKAHGKYTGRGLREETIAPRYRAQQGIRGGMYNVLKD